MGRLALPLGARNVFTVSVWEEFVLFFVFFWGGGLVGSGSPPAAWQRIHVF